VPRKNPIRGQRHVDSGEHDGESTGTGSRMARLGVPEVAVLGPTRTSRASWLIGPRSDVAGQRSASTIPRAVSSHYWRHEQSRGAQHLVEAGCCFQSAVLAARATMSMVLINGIDKRAAHHMVAAASRISSST